jgi:hypothetical protein
MHCKATQSLCFTTCKSKRRFPRTVKSLGRFLGWHLDGEWTVDNQRLSFLNFGVQSALLTNNLAIKSQKVKAEVNFKVEHEPSKGASLKSPVARPDVVAFSFGHEPYDIVQFDSFSTVVDMKGLGVFFFNGMEGGVVYLKEFGDMSSYNLQLVYDEDYKANGDMFCRHQYLNATTNLAVVLDFEIRRISITINDRLCISHHLSQNIFPTNKVAFSMVGYSSKTSPIKLSLDEFSISKSPLTPKLPTAYHSNSQSLISHLHTLDTLHHQNASLSNIMIVEVKLRGKNQEGCQTTAFANKVDRAAIECPDQRHCSCSRRLH